LGKTAAAAELTTLSVRMHLPKPNRSNYRHPTRPPSASPSPPQNVNDSYKNNSSPPSLSLSQRKLTTTTTNNVCVWLCGFVGILHGNKPLIPLPFSQGQ